MLLSRLLTTATVALIGIPTATLFVECIAALAKRKSADYTTDVLPRATILIPAHNEEAMLGKTLTALQPHLTDNIETVVIADNCTDTTADIARAADATVLERFHAVERGKGYALDHGMTYLESDPPDVVVMLDADCTVEPGGIAKLIATAHATQRPVQGVYLMKSPPEPSTTDLVSTLAFCVKNLVRPLGLYNLNQPCLLTGTGMAFPYRVLCDAPLASGNIVEDMQLGYDLALAGASPLLAPDVRVWGELPDERRVAATQRTRWEHGHMQTLLHNIPRLLSEAIRQRRFDLLTLALDLSIPPLALLVLIWIIISAIDIFFGIVASDWVPAAVSGSVGVLQFVGIGVAWMKFGRKIIPIRKLLAVPLYIAWKIPLYFKFLLQRQTAWVRTERKSL